MPARAHAIAEDLLVDANAVGGRPLPIGHSGQRGAFPGRGLADGPHGVLSLPEELDIEMHSGLISAFREHIARPQPATPPPAVLHIPALEYLADPGQGALRTTCRRHGELFGRAVATVAPPRVIRAPGGRGTFVFRLLSLTRNEWAARQLCMSAAALTAVTLIIEELRPTTLEEADAKTGTGCLGEALADAFFSWDGYDQVLRRDARLYGGQPYVPGEGVDGLYRRRAGSGPRLVAGEAKCIPSVKRASELIRVSERSKGTTTAVEDLFSIRNSSRTEDEPRPRPQKMRAFSPEWIFDRLKDDHERAGSDALDTEPSRPGAAPRSALHRVAVMITAEGWVLPVEEHPEKFCLDNPQTRRAEPIADEIVQIQVPRHVLVGLTGPVRRARFLDLRRQLIPTSIGIS